MHRFQIFCNIVTVLFLVLCWAGLRDGPARELPSVPIYKGHRNVTGLIVHAVLVNSGFHTQKFFPPKIIHNLGTPSEAFTRPALGQKKFEEYPFERAPNY
jgi:hypothetical protein